MKKIALDAWEKNKDRIRSYIEGHIYTDSKGRFGGLTPDRDVFLEEILKIAYGTVNNRLYFQLVDFGDWQGTLIAVFSEGNNYQPSVYQTHYAVLEYGSCSGCDSILAAASIDDLCTIAKDIVLSAKPIDETHCDSKWAEDCTV